MFDRELSFFIDHQNDLVAQYAGKILTIRGAEVVGVHDTPLVASDTDFKVFEPFGLTLRP